MSASSSVDLHLHSNCSDGSLPPAELVELAAAGGVAALAVCDHDNVDGCDEARLACRRNGIEFLSGVELSVVAGEVNDIHLLGYGFDPSCPPLVEALEEFRAFRRGRNAMIVDKINALLAETGTRPLDIAAIAAQAGGTLGRPHIARELVRQGHARDVDEAFASYLVPCNVPKRYFPVADAIDLLHAAGGVAVLAHPEFIRVDSERFRTLLDTFVAAGLDGLEVYFRGIGRQRCDWYLTEARQRGLLVTGGSDYHAPGDISPGRWGDGRSPIPMSCYREVEERLRERRGGEIHA